MWKLLLIAAGGAAGTLARYGTTVLFTRWAERTVFGVGVLAANCLGCFLIGYLQGLFISYKAIKPEVQLMLTVGFLGGYTTFSSYGWETLSFARDSDWFRAVLNILANNVLGLLLVALGYGLSRWQAYH